MAQRVNTMLDHAAGMVEFAAGLEAAGARDHARRVRLLAGDLATAAREWESEHRLRRRMEEDRDRWRDNRWREAHGTAWPK